MESGRQHVSHTSSTSCPHTCIPSSSSPTVPAGWTQWCTSPSPECPLPSPLHTTLRSAPSLWTHCHSHMISSSYVSSHRLCWWERLRERSVCTRSRSLPPSRQRRWNVIPQDTRSMHLLNSHSPLSPPLPPPLPLLPPFLQECLLSIVEDALEDLH